MQTFLFYSYECKETSSKERVKVITTGLCGSLSYKENNPTQVLTA